MERIYSIAEAAEYLGLSVWTLRMQIRKGKLVPDVRLPRACGFFGSTLAAYLAQHKRRTPEEQERAHAEIFARYEEGEKAEVLASEYGYAPGYIWHIVSKRRREPEDTAA